MNYLLCCSLEDGLGLWSETINSRCFHGLNWLPNKCILPFCYLVLKMFYCDKFKANLTLFPLSKSLPWPDPGSLFPICSSFGRRIWDFQRWEHQPCKAVAGMFFTGSERERKPKYKQWDGLLADSGAFSSSAPFPVWNSPSCAWALPRSEIRDKEHPTAPVETLERKEQMQGLLLRLTS